MKVQCSCGAKSVFEISSEMRTNPVRFLCPACGTDASEFVDGLVRQELGQTTTPGGRVFSVRATLETPSAAAQPTVTPSPASAVASPASPLKERKPSENLSPVSPPAVLRIRSHSPQPASGAPVSDPASIEFRPETRRIGDRRSVMPARAGGSVKMRPAPNE